MRLDPAHVTTPRLSLRRPTPDDLTGVFRVHGDPATQRFNPAGPDRDIDASRRRLAEWLAQWTDHGFGYWTVRSAEAPAILGFGGVRLEEWAGQPVLNLYYRLAPEAWGRGLATELARAAIDLGHQARPELPVQAHAPQDNVPSQRTAVAAGLVRRPDLDRAVHGFDAVVFRGSSPA